MLPLMAAPFPQAGGSWKVRCLLVFGIPPPDLTLFTCCSPPVYLRDRSARTAARSASFSFSFSSRWHCRARKGPHALVSQQSPQSCPRNSASICLVEHRSFSTLGGGISAASCSFCKKMRHKLTFLSHTQVIMY